MKPVITIVSAASLLIAAASWAQSPAPDNTKSNAVPANSAMKASIADGQSNSTADLKLTQQIRRSIVADKSLSTYAQNVKVVALNGAVTLNGVVKSAQEKMAIESKARAVAGTGKVTNDLSIATN